MWNWDLKKQMRQSRSKDPDVRGIERVAGRTKDERLEAFSQLPTCHLDSHTCRYRRSMSGDHRCGMARFADTSCEYKGKVEPLKQKVVEEQKREEALTITIEAPPEIEV